MASKELLNRLRAQETDGSHFTYIVLTLRKEHLEVRPTDRVLYCRAGGQQWRRSSEEFILPERLVVH